MKKFFKNLKIVFSIILIFVIIIPIYPVIEAANVSSFITKKEFDEALEKYNDKLAKFEAGIDSKIDFQVSTYLSRNGIWTPVPVVDFDKKALYITSVQADQVKCYDTTRNVLRNHTKIFVSWNMTAPKSGLFSMVYTMKASIAAGQNMIQIAYTSDSYTPGKDSTWYMFSDIIDDTNDKLYFSVIARPMTVPTSSTGFDKTTRINFRQFSDVCNIFVEKGKKYTMRVGDYWDFNGNANIELNGQRIPYPWYFDVKSANVY